MKSRQTEILAIELTTPLRQGIPLSAGTMRELINAENEHRRVKGEHDFFCILIDADVKNEFDNYLKDLSIKARSINKTVRSQVIIKKGAHFTTIDIHLSNDRNEFFVLDAAADMRSMQHYMAFVNAKYANSSKSLFENGYIASPTALDGGVTGGLQEDTFSCSAFALDHACQVSRIPNIYETLAKYADDSSIVSWSHLPPQLVWNAQSYEWLNNYILMHPTEIKIKVPGTSVTFIEYLEAAKKTLIIRDKVKLINGAIERSFSVYQDHAKDYIQRIRPAENPEGMPDSINKHTHKHKHRISVKTAKTPISPQSTSSRQNAIAPEMFSPSRTSIPKLDIENVSQTYSHEEFSDETEKDIKRSVKPSK